MSEQTVQERLDLLTTLESALSELQEEMAQEVKAAIPQEVKERIEEIEAEFIFRIQQANIDISSTKAVIKDDILVLDSTVKDIAVWSKGRVTWDGKGLAGYMVAHPGIGAFRKEGKPSVSIRRKK